jgi:bifunctional DNA-binding transcriptional regulator/antitoxin component of YhaV-PrlF toxin-antitoxin module
MGYKQRRRIINLRTSKGITLPKGWLDYHGLEAHDELTILGDRVIVVTRPEDEGEAQRILEALEKKKVGDNVQQQTSGRTSYR